MILRRKTLSAWSAAALAGIFFFLPRAAVADTLRISGTGGAIGTMRFLGEAFRKLHPDVQIVIVPSMGSSGGVKAVVAGRLDIGLCGRPTTEKERAQGIMDVRYSKTPFVFAVNQSVKRNGITLATAVEIYSGKKIRWEDGRRVRLVLRPATDSDIPVLQGMSPEMDAAVETAMRREGMVVAMTDQDAADALESIPGAFGAITLSLVLSEERNLRVLALNGIAPVKRAAANPSYPFYKTFCMVTRKDPPPAVRRFMEFVQSPAGAAILAKYGQIAVP